VPERAETVAILCGGRGTRLQEHTHAIPKALVEIGGRPILWHVIRIYASHGFRRFLLLTGYRGEMIAGFAAAEAWPPGVAVECLETGEETQTGGRIALAANRIGDGTFALTYADGVADIDLGAALTFHRAHGDAATVTLVRPRSQWGVAMIDDDDRIAGFAEKPRMEQWVNAGFFVLRPTIFDVLKPGEELVQEPFQRLIQKKELITYKYDGFFVGMDTFKEKQLLDDMYARGETPWEVWKTPQTS